MFDGIKVRALLGLLQSLYIDRAFVVLNRPCNVFARIIVH